MIKYYIFAIAYDWDITIGKFGESPPTVAAFDKETFPGSDILSF